MLYIAQCFEIIHLSHGFEIVACLFILSPKQIMKLCFFTIKFQLFRQICDCQFLLMKKYLLYSVSFGIF